MSWYVYLESAIDYNWECLASVAQTAQQLGGHAAALRTGVHPGFPPATEDLNRFLKAWESACIAASAAGWEGDFMQGPVVFWLPAANATFFYGFVFKQLSNGQTYVISPCELTWLGNLVSEPQPAPAKKSVLGNLLDAEE